MVNSIERCWDRPWSWLPQLGNLHPVESCSKASSFSLSINRLKVSVDVVRSTMPDHVVYVSCFDEVFLVVDRCDLRVLLDLLGLQTYYCPFWLLLLFHYVEGILWFFTYQSKSHELLVSIHHPLCLADNCQVFYGTNMIKDDEELPSIILNLILLG